LVYKILPLLAKSFLVGYTEDVKKILLADDDRFLGKSYKLKLDKDGFSVTLVHSGKEVLESLEKELPDLLLLDLIMPGKDGFTTLEEISKNPKYKDLLIIVSTNLSQQEDKEKVKKLGAKGYIIKSDLSLAEFSAQIKKILG
jgi:DNA-binding response OmpR family regulator